MSNIENNLSQGNDSFLTTNISVVPQKNLTLDIDQLRAYTDLLDGGNQVYRAFYDKKESHKVFYPEGDVDDVKDELIKLIKKGYGIFTVVNGKNYKKVSKGVTLADEDITKIRSHFVDLDEAPLQPVLDTGFKPHLIVQSSNTVEKGQRFQVYWKVSDCPVDRYEEIQKKIAKRFNGDSTVCNPSRVMRTPGTPHQKYDPCRCEILEINPQLPIYTLQQIIDGLGLEIEPVKTRVVPQRSRTQKNGQTDESEHRNNTLCKVAGRLEDKNRTYDEIMAGLQAENCLFREPVDARKISEVMAWIWEKRQTRITQLNTLVDELKNLEAGTPRVEAIQNDEVNNLLCLAQDTDPVLWSTLEDLFKSRNKLSYLKNAVKRGPALTLAGTSNDMLLSEIPGCPAEYPGTFDCYPTVHGYRFLQHDRGVRILKDNSEHPEEICHTPVFITKRLVRDHQDTFLEAAWLEKGRWRYLEALRSSFLNANRILDLGDRGFPVGTANNRSLAQYLQAFESTHLNLIPEQKTSSQMGWKGKSFLLGQEYISVTEDQTPIQFHGPDGGEESLVGGIRQRGDYNQWVEAIKTVSQYSFSMTALYASAAAPLLKILETPSILVDFSALSSTGKTINLHVAASFWGQPDETMSPSVTHTWDMTDVAIERLCSVMCDLPVILDETKRQKQERISKNIYTIIHGQGRARGSKRGMQVTKSWRVVCLSTGEAPIVSYTTDTGVRARTLSLRGQPFGINNHQTKQLVEKLNDTIKHNYGYAGPMFLKWLVDNQDRWPEFKDKLRDNITKLKAKAGVSFRLANSAAVITTAGQLLHEALVLPWTFDDPIAKVWPQLLKDSEDADICDRALVVLGDYVASHPDRFYNKYAEEKGGKMFTPNSGFFGRRDDSITYPWTHIDFIPSRLKDICKSEGLDYGAVVQGFEDKKMMKLKSCDFGGDSRKVIRVSKRTLMDDQSGGCAICANNFDCEKEPCQWNSWADRCALFVHDTNEKLVGKNQKKPSF